MKNLKIISLIACLFGLLASSSQAMQSTEYKIEVCVLPLKNIVVEKAKGLVGSLQHMFVRGTVNGEVTSLNFEPEDMENGWVNGKSKIGYRNFPEATCSELIPDLNKELFDELWSAIVSGYKDYSSHNFYQVVGSNCQDATIKVLGDLGHEIPVAITEILDSQESFGIKKSDLDQIAKSPLGQSLLQLAGDKNTQENCCLQ